MAALEISANKVGFVIELGIHRHQVIDAVMLHGMAAVVEHRHVGIGCGASEADRQLLHVGLVEIGAQDHLESALA
mgnify:CR=1 FL=1